MHGLCLLVAATGLVWEGQGRLPSASDNEFVIKLIARLKVRLDIQDWPPGCRRPPGPPTRHEDAAFLYAAYRSFTQPTVKRELGVEYRALVELVGEAVKLRARELSDMGVDVGAMKLHLKALPSHEGFEDVPPTYWASKAARELKGLGLLRGYPDGLLRGESVD